MSPNPYFSSKYYTAKSNEDQKPTKAERSFKSADKQLCKNKTKHPMSSNSHPMAAANKLRHLLKGRASAWGVTNSLESHAPQRNTRLL